MRSTPPHPRRGSLFLFRLSRVSTAFISLSLLPRAVRLRCTVARLTMRFNFPRGKLLARLGLTTFGKCAPLVNVARRQRAQPRAHAPARESRIDPVFPAERAKGRCCCYVGFKIFAGTPRRSRKITAALLRVPTAMCARIIFRLLLLFFILFVFELS